MYWSYPENNHWNWCTFGFSAIPKTDGDDSPWANQHNYKYQRREFRTGTSNQHESPYSPWNPTSWGRATSRWIQPHLPSPSARPECCRFQEMFQGLLSGRGNGAAWGVLNVLKGQLDMPRKIGRPRGSQNSSSWICIWCISAWVFLSAVTLQPANFWAQRLATSAPWLLGLKFTAPIRTGELSTMARHGTTGVQPQPLSWSSTTTLKPLSHLERNRHRGLRASFSPMISSPTGHWVQNHE